MNNDLVIFPPHVENIRFTWRARYFFISHKIKMRDSESFPLDLLRIYYKEDNEKGALLYTELFLYGFSFHTEIPMSFYPEDCDPDGPVIISADKGSFPLTAIKNPKLKKLFKDFEVMVRSDVNGMHYDRLLRYLGTKSCLISLRNLGYAITPWSKLDMENYGSRFIYWPEGREGLAIPNFFLPFLADLMSSSPSLLSFYQRVGVKRYEDFFHLNFGRVEYMSRLIAKQGMGRYEAGKHQVALWAFAYRLEEAKRALNEADLDMRFLFLPIPKGLSEEQESLLKKYSLISLPFGHNIDLATSFTHMSLPKALKSLSEPLSEFGIKDLSVFTIFALNKKIDAYHLDKALYSYGVDPSLYLEVALASLKNGIEAPSLDSPSKIEEKAAVLFASNEPEKALDLLFSQTRFIPLEELKKTPGLSAYLHSEESQYTSDEDSGLAFKKDSRASLENDKAELFFFPSIVPFEEMLTFYEKNGASPLNYLEEKANSIEYDPYPSLILPKNKKEREERGIPSCSKRA